MSKEEHGQHDPRCAWYPDKDGDGHGNPNVDAVYGCTDPGGGRVNNATDCDDTDADRHPDATWYLDADRDSFGGVVSDVACLPPTDRYVARTGDCDDSHELSHPKAVELCDDRDNDCDDKIDEDLTFQNWFRDVDGDGFGADASRQWACARPSPGWVQQGGDCADDAAAAHPGGTEVCDGLDNDCDNGVDDGLSFTDWWPDADDDGQGALVSATAHCADPGAGWAQNSTDCDDTDASRFVGATERCDGLDNDCNGSLWAEEADADGDGRVACTFSAGPWVGVSDDEDCDDGQPLVFPGAFEICDGLDSDCDGTLPDREKDQDADGAVACGFPDGDAANWHGAVNVTADGDCDDDDAATHVGGTEVCDGRDNDCDGALSTPEADLDVDGYVACVPVAGASVVGGDCDDTLGTVRPAGIELCDGLDNDCDGANDPQEPGLPWQTWWPDGDGDGQGDANRVSEARCDGPPDTDWVSNGTDCNDADTSVFVGATEICDGRDNDCDGTLPDDESDLDGDGAVACAFHPSGWDGAAYFVGQDCDDGDNEVFPGAYEACDGKRNNPGAGCEQSVPVEEIDGDSDGYVDCVYIGDDFLSDWRGPGTVVGDRDCNDANSDIHPNAIEQCDDVDEDCDGLVDEGLPETTWWLDNDGDGYGDPNLAALTDCNQPPDDNGVPYVNQGGDCDDDASDDDLTPVPACDGKTVLSAINRNPGVTECCDGLDWDCDLSGFDPESLDAFTYYRDADGDLFGDDAITTASCSTVPLPGYAIDNTDCDDTAEDRNPALLEYCNGVDNNCDQLVDNNPVDATFYYDGDSDTFGDPGNRACSDLDGVGGQWITDNQDCNDSDATVYPGAPEDIGDGVDSNCDGDADGSGMDYAITIYGPAGGGTRFGFLTTLPDGRLLIRGNDPSTFVGQVWVFGPPFQSGFADDLATHLLVGVPGGYLWSPPRSGLDVTGDGEGDLVFMSQTTPKEVLVWPGPLPPCAPADMPCVVNVHDTAWVISGTADRPINSVYVVPSVTNDSVADVLILTKFDPDSSNAGYFRGSVELMAGPITSDLSIDDGLARFDGSDQHGNLTRVAVGDFNRDGRGDLFFGEPYALKDGGSLLNAAGKSHPWEGPIVAGTYSLTTTPLQFRGNYGTSRYGDLLGKTVRVLDLDGDGYDDLVSGGSRSGYTNGQELDGRLYMVSGARVVSNGWTGSLKMQEYADSVVFGEGNDAMGAAHDFGDMNCDGVPDLITLRWPSLGDGVGVLFMGPLLDGNHTQADGVRRWTADTSLSDVRVVGDMDGGGADDIVFAEIYANSNDGAAHIFTGEAIFGPCP